MAADFAMPHPFWLLQEDHSFTRSASLRASNTVLDAQDQGMRCSQPLNFLLRKTIL
jgi:hypothetical protein